MITGNRLVWINGVPIVLLLFVLSGCSKGTSQSGGTTQSSGTALNLTDAPGHAMGGLKSFADHPQPIIDSLAQQKEVWLLDGYMFKGEGGKSASMYLVFGGDKLEFVCKKQEVGKGNWQAKDFGIYFWEKFQAGESHLGKNLSYNWKGSKQADHVVAELHEKHQIDTNPRKVLEVDSTDSISVMLKPGSDECRWEREQIRFSKTRGESGTPQRKREFVEGVGKRLKG